MRRARLWANLLLGVAAAIAFVHSTGAISGGGAAVRIAYLENAGVVDRGKACELNSAWCDREALGRFVAAQYHSGEAYLAIIAIVVSLLNLSGLRKPVEPRDANGLAGSVVGNQSSYGR